MPADKKLALKAETRLTTPGSCFKRDIKIVIQQQMTYMTLHTVLYVPVQERVTK